MVELMVSLVMFSFAMAGILAVSVSLSAGLREQRRTVQTQDNARASMDFIADAIRGASPAVPAGNIQHIQTCATGALSITNSTTGPDDLTIVFSSGSVVASTRTAYGSGTTSLTLTDASQLAAGDTLLISNQSQGHLLPVTAVDTSSGIVTIGAQTCSTLSLPSGGYAAGSLVIRVQRARFYIDTVDGSPTLMMDPDAEGPSAGEPLAEGIEDLQIAEGVDADGDGGVTEVGTAANDDEWAYNVVGDNAPSGTVRAIRVSLIARTLTFAGKTPVFSRPALEDHAAATTNDDYRRRVLSSIFEVRNFTGSP